MLKELDFSDIEVIEKIYKFLSNSEYSDYMQSIEWNNIRNEKNKYYLYYVDNFGNIIFTCSLMEKTKGNKKILYSPRGPILNYNDTKIIKIFVDEIKIWMKNKNYFKLVINPIIKDKELKNIKQIFNCEVIKYDDYDNLFESSKLAIVKIFENEEKLINKLQCKTRYNIRKSYKNNLISKQSENVDLNNFYKLYLETSIRHEFNPHNLEYFKNLIKIFKNNIIFFEVWKDDIPLAMSIDVLYNGKLLYVYGASSSNNRELLGMYNMHWEAIKFCFKNGIKEYDLGGVFCNEKEIGNKDYGLYRFKKGYCYEGFIDIIPDIVFDFEE